METPDAAALLATLIRPSVSLRQLAAGLYSCLGEADGGALYDARARIYDFLVGSRLYNRIAWGTSPRDYEAFARHAVASSNDGWVLDIAGGSCLATAGVYATTRRPIVIVDRSLGMLKRGRQRVIQRAGGLPQHVVFVQGDLFALPFVPEQASTVLALGALHLFDEGARFLRALVDQRRPDGSLFVSSLVRGRWLSTRLLTKMHSMGEVASPRALSDVTKLATEVLGPHVSTRAAGAMAYVETMA